MIFIVYSSGDYANALLHFEKGLTSQPQVRDLLSMAGKTTYTLFHVICPGC